MVRVICMGAWEARLGRPMPRWCALFEGPEGLPGGGGFTPQLIHQAYCNATVWGGLSCGGLLGVSAAERSQKWLHNRRRLGVTTLEKRWPKCLGQMALPWAQRALWVGEVGGWGAGIGRRGEVPHTPSGRPAYAQPLSPQHQAPASMAFVTDRNRPRPLWQPRPTACLTASGATSEVPPLLMHPWWGGWAGSLEPQFPWCGRLNMGCSVGIGGKGM